VRIKHASNQDHRESLETVTSFEQNTIIESNKTHAEAKTLCRFFSAAAVSINQKLTNVHLNGYDQKKALDRCKTMTSQEAS